MCRERERERGTHDNNIITAAAGSQSGASRGPAIVAVARTAAAATVYIIAGERDPKLSMLPVAQSGTRGRSTDTNPDAAR